MDKISREKLENYFKITKEALEEAKKSENRAKLENERKDFLDMIERYYKDAIYFKDNGQIVNSFAAIVYAHGWLDAGARIGLFDVHNNKLFTVE